MPFVAQTSLRHSTRGSNSSEWTYEQKFLCLKKMSMLEWMKNFRVNKWLFPCNEKYCSRNKRFEKKLINYTPAQCSALLQTSSTQAELYIIFSPEMAKKSLTDQLGRTTIQKSLYNYVPTRDILSMIIQLTANVLGCPIDNLQLVLVH